MGFERMDRFLSIVRQQNPQQAAAALVRYATEGGTGNMRLYRSAMNVLRAEERTEFASLVMRQMGAPTASARGVVQETGFSPSRFATAYEKMAPEARNQILRRSISKRLRIFSELPIALPMSRRWPTRREAQRTQPTLACLVRQVPP